MERFLRLRFDLSAKNDTRLYLPSPQRRHLNQDTNDRKGDEQDGRSGRRKHNRALNQVRTDKRGNNDQRPIKQNEQQYCANNSAHQKDKGGVLRVVNKKSGCDCAGKFAACEETENGNGNFLKEQREQSPN